MTELIICSRFFIYPTFSVGSLKYLLQFRIIVILALYYKHMKSFFSVKEKIITFACFILEEMFKFVLFDLFEIF